MTDLTGKVLSLASLTAEKPLVLFFIDCECSCSRDAAPFLNQIQAAYGKNCTVVGVTNSGADVARAWFEQVGPQFPIIADPDLAIIGAYRAKRSVYTIVVEPGGKIVKTYPGYSAETLTELSATIARLGGVSVRPLTFEGAPKKLVSGCPFPGREKAK